MPESHPPPVVQVQRVKGAAGPGSFVAGGALGGLVFGAIAGYGLLPYVLSFGQAKALAAVLGYTLEAADMFWFPAVLGAAIGVIGGAIQGVVAHTKATRRTAGLQRLAESLEAEVSPDPDPELSDKLGKFFPQGHSHEVRDVMRAQIDGVGVTVGELSFVVESANTTGNRGSTTRTSRRQTVAYYESPAVRFPGFTLQPEGTLLNLLSRATGVEDIDFPAHAEFSRAYHLTAVHPENTRRLFNDRLLEGLSRRQGLHIASDSGSLVIYRQGWVCDAAQLKDFVGEAAALFRLFEDAARESAATAETMLTPKADIRAIAEKMPGLMGKILRERLVTRDDIGAFIRQPPPRTIPASILRYSDKFAPNMVLLIGIMFAVTGAAFALAFGYEALARGKGLMNDRGAGVLVGLIFLGSGGGIAFFAGRARLRILRLLRYGQLGAARIQKIEPTGVSINDNAISRMTVQFPAAGQVVQASCKITEDAAQRAHKLVADKKDAPILYDPADPQRILFVEALLNVSAEYEP